MSSTIKAIIFDCFGVLRPDVIREVYERMGGDTKLDDVFISDTLYHSHMGRIPSSAPVFAERLGVSTEDWIKEVNADPNDQELLDYILSLRKKYKVGVLSNMGSGGLLRYFTAEELGKYFHATAVSGEIGFAKPQAVAYETIAGHLGVRLDECVFVDDRELYCEGARAVGMHAMLYKNLAQFRKDLEKLLSQS
ncbi:MAG TPA: HAD-IA family hydrolase [Candidatus Saccharimonadales bacterium]|nr:HAD-IA family hydrolase [Candidatus Saccharimonadales bacterium]